MLRERDYTLMGGPHYKPKHPVDITEGVRMLRDLESRINAIKERLEADMATHNGRREIVGRLRIAETNVAFAEMWVWNTEAKVAEEACEIYKIIMLPAYVKRALVDAGYRTKREVYQHGHHSEKVPGIGKRGEQYIRNWKDRQKHEDIYE